MSKMESLSTYVLHSAVALFLFTTVLKVSWIPFSCLMTIAIFAKDAFACVLEIVIDLISTNLPGGHQFFAARVERKSESVLTPCLRQPWTGH